jgi:hypothetical protein
MTKLLEVGQIHHMIGSLAAHLFQFTNNLSKGLEVLSHTMGSAPFSAKAKVQALPMPWPAPVINTIWPSSDISRVLALEMLEAVTLRGRLANSITS